MNTQLHFRIFKFPNFRILGLAFLLSLTSCFKEKPLAPPSKQNIGQTALIEMVSPYYPNQFFYSLKTNSVVSSNSRFAYDLLFDCDVNQFHIWLNTSHYMSAAKTNKTDLAAVSMNDITGLDFHYELGAFNPDSNVIGQWWDSLGTSSSAQKVYVVDLGKDATGNFLGYVKMKVNGFLNNSYSISYAAFNDTTITTRLISKDDNSNYRYFNFANKNVVNGIEPPKADWDLCFTHYTDIVPFEQLALPYEVTGVLHNPSRVTAYLDSTLVFDSLQISDVNFSRLETRRDAIGYKWKTYSLPGSAQGTYSTNTHYTYFIRTDEDRYYKLHFISFEKDGQIGYPSFEFYRL